MRWSWEEEHRKVTDLSFMVPQHIVSLCEGKDLFDVLHLIYMVLLKRIL